PSGPVERRPAGFGRPDEEYNRGFEYDGPRFYPNGGPRGYHGEDQRGYHGDSLHFPNERRGIPPSRRPYPYPSRPPPREDPHTTRQMEFSGRAAPPPPSVRAQGMYPAPRSLSAVVPEGGDDTLMQAILNLDRGYTEGIRKGPLPPLRADVPPSPHSRSGSTVSSKSYSPDRAKGLPHPLGMNRFSEILLPASGATQDTISLCLSPQEEAHVLEWDREEGLPPIDETPKTQDDFQERRAQAIGAKAREIEQVPNTAMSLPSSTQVYIPPLPSLVLPRLIYHPHPT
uniref:Periphilin 1 n=1 Tax=Oncorhynchus kisutch TaxID=8019 RepID=A0A8C7IN72_ONCKI